MLNKYFIEKKISLIREDIVRLKQLGSLTAEEIFSNFGKQAIIERLMERIVTRAIDINQHLISCLEKNKSPENYRDTFLFLSDLGIYDKDFGEKIAKSVGLRNILIHDYDKVDYTILYSSISDCILDYVKYCNYIIQFLDK
ncbi:MAG TPA: DUF86 domain-containing protein [Candidatus Pacearchaeota archaeon]|nr:DUF86 domain-containing protein [Candidatus Pacearchaeota archaeon]